MTGLSLLAPVAKRFSGKVALITGAASGIGACSAKLFVQHGAKVVIADIQDELGQSVCKEIGCNEAVSYVHCDVASESDVKNAVDTAVSKYGKLDVMFSNAGILDSVRASISTVDYPNFKSVFDVNVYGALLAAKHASRIMIPANKGSIIFTSSDCSVSAGHGSHIYAASKHAVVGLAKNLSVELGQLGIRVNCISPYGIPTPLLLKAVGQLDRKEMMAVLTTKANLKGEQMEEEDVARAALYLASEESKYVSGLNLVVDGGLSC